ncbi:MAG: CopD family protein [Myxococcota bacterium]
MESWATWALAFHIVGIVLWYMGMMRTSTLLGSHASATPDEAKVYAQLSRKMLFAGIIPGLIVSLGTGLAILLAGYPSGFAYFKKAGWMHTKLTMVLVLIGISIYLGLSVRKVANAQPGDLSGTPFKAIHGVLGLMLILIAVLAIVKPFQG